MVEQFRWLTQPRATSFFRAALQDCCDNPVRFVIHLPLMKKSSLVPHRTIIILICADELPNTLNMISASRCGITYDWWVWLSYSFLPLKCRDGALNKVSFIMKLTSVFYSFLEDVNHFHYVYYNLDFWINQILAASKKGEKGEVYHFIIPFVAGKQA